jgi:Flp pilus assembly protein TadD
LLPANYFIIYYHKIVSPSLVHFLGVITYKPNDAEAYYNKGVTLADLGRFEEAVKAYDLAIKYKPDFTQAINNKNKILKNKANIR